MTTGYASGHAVTSASRPARLHLPAYARAVWAAWHRPRPVSLAAQRQGGTAITSCAFCDIITGQLPAHVVLADEYAVAFLDARPLFKGHVLVAPREHIVTLADLPADLVGPFFLRVQQVSAVMPAALGSQGSFVAANNVVSQSVPHLHVHVVPRTKGDGLRGFFWPRQRYASDEEAEQYAQPLRSALAGN